MWRLDDPQGNEAGKIRHHIVPYTRGRGLDLGCGPSKAFAHFIGVDSGKDTELYGIHMKPDVTVKTCSDLGMFGTESMDFVFSSHLLEHIDDTFGALSEWWRLIKVGGHLVLYLPHKDFYPNIGTPGSNPDHKHDFVPHDIVTAMKMVGGWDLLVNEERNGGQEYSFYQVYRKRSDNAKTFPCQDESQGPTVCVVRYGGFGDQLQAISLLPELKRDGYIITMMTTPSGHDIIKHDPHVDHWIIQDDDQVPNHELADFWLAQSERFDRFINLSESVEGTLLAMPGRANHQWPHSVRHKYLNKNYLEFTFELAELPFFPEPKFYTNEAEDEFAEGFKRGVAGRAGIESPYFIMWALAGSSLHKFYPWQDSVIARIMLEIPDAVVVLVGDMACKILEAGWESEKRVFLTSGDMTIRETLTMATHSDCVVGPETGVLNAVGFDPGIHKVCFLSHSSHENLTRDWKNAVAMEPQHIPCYPCHRLHYGREWCHEHEETGTAICAASIDPDQVFEAIRGGYEARQTDRAIQE